MHGSLIKNRQKSASSPQRCSCPRCDLERYQPNSLSKAVCFYTKGYVGLLANINNSPNPTKEGNCVVQKKRVCAILQLIVPQLRACRNRSSNGCLCCCCMCLQCIQECTLVYLGVCVHVCTSASAALPECSLLCFHDVVGQVKPHQSCLSHLLFMLVVHPYSTTHKHRATPHKSQTYEACDNKQDGKTFWRPTRHTKEGKE